MKNSTKYNNTTLCPLSLETVCLQNRLQYILAPIITAITHTDTFSATLSRQYHMRISCTTNTCKSTAYMK